MRDQRPRSPRRHEGNWKDDERKDRCSTTGRNNTLFEARCRHEPRVFCDVCCVLRYAALTRELILDTGYRTRKERRKEGRKEGYPACGCVASLCCLHKVCGRCSNCLVSCVLCFCAWSAAVCHCASEGARLPTLRSDTRSGCAMHSLLRPLSRFHTVRSGGLLPGGTCHNLGPQMWVWPETVAGPTESLNSRPGGATMQSRPENASENSPSGTSAS